MNQINIPLIKTIKSDFQKRSLSTKAQAISFNNLINDYIGSEGQDILNNILENINYCFDNNHTSTETAFIFEDNTYTYVFKQELPELTTSEIESELDSIIFFKKMFEEIEDKDFDTEEEALAYENELKDIYRPTAIKKLNKVRANTEITCLVNKTSTYNYIVFVEKQFKTFSFHIRQFWNDRAEVKSYDKKDLEIFFNNTSNRTFEENFDALSEINLILENYSNENINSCYRMSKPNLETVLKNGLKYQDDRDIGYIASFKHSEKLQFEFSGLIELPLLKSILNHTSYLLKDIEND